MPNLYATLPADEVNQLKKIIQTAKQLTPISPKGLFYDIENNGISSVYYPPLNSFFNDLVGSKNQTDTMLHSLMQLNICFGNLVNQPFPCHQVLALTGLMLVTDGKPATTFKQSIEYMLSCKGELELIADVAPAKIIMEYSIPKIESGNAENIIATQNKLLAITALFRGDPDDVQLTFLQAQRIRAANFKADIKLVGGSVRGLPIGNFEETFKGFSQVIVTPSMNPDKEVDDSVIWGSSKADNLSVKLNTNAHYYGIVVLAGDASDNITADFSVHSGVHLCRGYENCLPGNSVYLAGNAGSDQYNLKSFESLRGDINIGFYDSDHRDSITVERKLYNGRVTVLPFAGFVIDGIFKSWHVIDYLAKYGAEVDQTTTLTLTLLGSTTQPSPEIQIFNYQAPDYGILPNTVTYSIPISLERSPNLATAVTPQGKVAICGQYDWSQSIYIYNSKGILENKVSLLLPPDSIWRNFAFTADASGNFHVGGSLKGSCELTHIFVDSKTLQPVTAIIDATTLPDCDSDEAFPKLNLAATGNSVALAYAKQEAISKYGLYSYIPSKGINRLGDIKPNHYRNTYDYGIEICVTPTRNGFLVSSFLPREGYSSESGYDNVFEITSTGQVTSNLTLTDIAIFRSNSFGDKNFILYRNDTVKPNSHAEIFTSFFRNGKFDSSLHLGTILNGNFGYGCNQFSGPLLQPLNSRNMLILGEFGFSSNLNHIGSYIISEDNVIEIGPFSVVEEKDYEVHDGVSAGRLQNGDVILTYNVLSNGGSSQKILTLPTSLLSKQLQPQRQPKPTVQKSNFVQQQKHQATKPVVRALPEVVDATPLTQTQTSSASSLAEHSFVLRGLVALGGLLHLKQSSQVVVPTVESTNTQSEPLSFDFGKWNDDIAYDARTKEPIFTYEVYRDDKVVGAAKFYGQPLLCADKNGQRNNLLETTGELSHIRITQEMSVEEVCRALPPTLFDRVSSEVVKHAGNVATSVAISSAEPALRGFLNGVGLEAQSSANVAEDVSTNLLLSYGSVAGIAGKYATPYVQKALHGIVSPSVTSVGVTLAAGAVEAVVTGNPWSPVVVGTQIAASAISSRIQPVVEETFRRAGEMARGIVSAANRFSFWASVEQPVTDMPNKSTVIPNFRT